MGKVREEHPVTKTLRLIDSLSDDEKRIIYDHVRPAPKLRQKAKDKTLRCAMDGCGKVTTALIHDTDADEFDHLFKFPSKSKPERKPSQKRKAGKEATDETKCRNCGATFNHNIHHLSTTPGYHEFVEPAGEAKGAGTNG